MVAAQKRWVGRVIRFSEIMHLDLGSMADFGCGPAFALFELAKRLPNTRFYGFDASPEIIENNIAKVRKLGLVNIAFQQAKLPRVPTSRLFNLIVCIATLHYVRENLLAIRNLHRLLEPGGFLIFNYPNLQTMRWYRTKSDPSMKDRFDLVVNGANILSKKDIESGLNSRARNFWVLLGEESKTANPCLFVSRKIRNDSQ